jgi:hypothetical protein
MFDARTNAHTHNPPACKLAKATAVQWVLLEIMKLPIYHDKSLQIQKLKKIQNTQINSCLFTVNESSVEKKMGITNAQKVRWYCLQNFHTLKQYTAPKIQNKGLLGSLKKMVPLHTGHTT